MKPPFQRLLDEACDDVWRVCLAAAGPQAAEDCYQETWASALQAYPGVTAGDLRAWVCTIAWRKAMDHHRVAKRTVPVERTPDRPVASHADQGEPQPELWEAVRALPDGQRLAVVMRYVADLPYAGVAQTLGCTEPAARQRVREAMKTLRKVMA